MGGSVRKRPKGDASFWDRLGESPCLDYPNGLAEEPTDLPSRWWWLALLVVVCLIPRIWMALTWDVLWADTVAYLKASQAFERGDYADAFGRWGLNTYPVILWALRSCGVPWEQAGEWFSVAMASLAVLPLFGWVRRQFDDRIAVMACLLYAMHPKLVAFSPLIIRDPTFWFLFNLSIYLGWRAVTEIRWWLFLALGLSLSLAIHTRIEGWLLLILLVPWAGWRWIKWKQSRTKLIAGVILSIAMIPMSVVLVNLTLLRDCPHWELGQTSHFTFAWRWTQSSRKVVLPQSTPASPQGQATKPRLPEVSVGFTLARKLGIRLVKAYTYAFGILLLGGIWVWRKTYARSDHLVPALMSIIWLVAVWIRYFQSGIDIRYFMPIVLVSLPWIALGVWGFAGIAASRTRNRVEWSPGRRSALVAALFAGAVLAGLFSMKTKAGPVMRQQAALGRWIQEELGSGQRLGGNIGELRLVEYYARGRVVEFAKGRGVFVPRILTTIGAKHPGVVMLWGVPEDGADLGAYGGLLERMAKLGYQSVPRANLPAECDGIRVFVRKEVPGR